MWYELAQNPEAIRSLFTTEIVLDEVSLFSVQLDRDGPAIRLRFDLKRFPDSPPARWRTQGFNRAQLTVEFFDVDEVSILGWSRENPGRCEVIPEEGRVSVRIAGDTCSVHFKAGFFRIGAVSGYVDSTP